MEAAWINIHVFGGVVEDDNDDDSKSVLEIRNLELESRCILHR